MEQSIEDRLNEMKNETALNSVSTAGLQDAAPITSEIKPKKSPCEYYNGYLKVSAQKKQSKTFCWILTHFQQSVFWPG